MMPKRGVAALVVTTIALVLLLSFKTPDDTLPTRNGGVSVVERGAQPSAAPRATRAPTSNGTPAADPTPNPTSAPRGAATATTIVGPLVSTRFGPVQVQIAVVDGRLQDVTALQLPTGRHSGQISDFSEPVLREEALSAQSANIDIVSGATYTSLAYARSLQAALDQAGLG